MTTLPRTEDVLARARDARAFSAVTAEIGRRSGPLWRYAAGTLGFTPGAASVAVDTIFDLASLTKVLATATLAARLVSAGRLDLEQRVSELVAAWNADDRRDVRVRDLLEHASGLPAYREYFRERRGIDEYIEAIAREPLESAPRTQAVYSDVGFILFGAILERAGSAPLDAQFGDWQRAAGLHAPLRYLPPEDWRARTAMTEDDPWRGRLLQGEVHDENAAALGGVAAHAGLFGTAAAVGEAARWWMARLAGEDDRGSGVTASVARRFVQRSSVPSSSRALGWDTMRPTSSCGTRMSEDAVGHTGFTGTSLWIDPRQDLYFVLLTNRVHPTRANEAIQAVRRAFHDAAITELTR